MLLEHADKAKGRIARIDSIKDAPIYPNQMARRSRLRAADQMDQDGGKAAPGTAGFVPPGCGRAD
jgi:hypothetical protein